MASKLASQNYNDINYMVKNPGVRIQLNFKTLLVFLFFFFLMHELHELAHIFTGRLICGCWGTRDFNVWAVCSACENNKWAVAATFAGPLFTFAMLWLGRYLIKKGNPSLGLVFVLGNMQFGRIYMAAMGSGDEISGFRTLFLHPDHSNSLIIRLATLALVTLICLPPMITAYRAIANNRRPVVFLILIILPLILDTIVILILLNGLLGRGILNQTWIMGTPAFITLWLLLCLTIVIASRGTLIKFGKAAAN